MIKIHDINIINDPSIFFVFLIDPPIEHVYSYHQLRSYHYENIIGPIPVQELDCKMPTCLFSVKRWCLESKQVKRKNTKYNNRFVNGDLIIFSNNSGVQGGFYTDHHPLGSFEEDAYPLLKLRKTDPCGFMYVDSRYINKDIIKHVGLNYA